MENEQQQTKKYWFFGSKLNTVLLLVLIVLMVIALKWMFENKKAYVPVITKQYNNIPTDVRDPYMVEPKDTYKYKNHGFTIELPKGFIPREEQSEGGPSTIISMPNGSSIVYVTNADFWEENNLVSIEENFCTKGTQKIGNNTFKICKDSYSSNPEFYWIRIGKIGYELHGNKESFKTFTFVGWN